MKNRACKGACDRRALRIDYPGVPVCGVRGVANPLAQLEQTPWGVG